MVDVMKIFAAITSILLIPSICFADMPYKLEQDFRKVERCVDGDETILVQLESLRRQASREEHGSDRFWELANEIGQLQNKREEESGDCQEKFFKVTIEAFREIFKRLDERK